MFKNEKQNDRQPDYKGTIVIAGKTYEIAAWERRSQRGTSYLSLQASEPRERSNQGTTYNQQRSSGNTGYYGHNTEPAPAPPMPEQEFQTVDDLEDLPF